MRTVFGIGLVALLSTPAFGQSADRPSFEIADVHASARSVNPQFNGGFIRDGRYQLRNATMLDLIRTAYSVDADKVQGGPNWLELDRFDVIAKVPPSTPLDVAKRMLQSLLADRFKLVVRQDTRSMATHVLSLGSGKPKLKEASSASGCQPQQQTPEPSAPPRQVMVCRGVTMAALAELLPRIAGGYVQSTVVDKTGLQGSWDFELAWTPRLALGIAGADATTIFDAIDKQLGLKLEMQKLDAAAFVVDSVNRTPTDNPPGLAAAFPPLPPAEFEVADLKPSPPDGPGPQAQIQPTGIVNARGVPLRLLLSVAWNLNNDEMIVGPKFLDTAKVDLVARAFTPTGPAAATTTQPPIDIDTVREMVRALVIDRFKIKFHMEDRPVTAYTLSSVKPKLTKADPSSRTRCLEGPAPDAKDPRNVNPLNSRLITCQNMTMAQFAERLQGLAGGYVRAPVEDATGLEGAWNFSVNFSPAGLVGRPGGAGRGGEAGQQTGVLAASDPTGALTLPEAVDRQLGLKLELKKRPLPVLVIDHIEEKPTDN